VLDNIAPLEALAGEAMATDAYLIAPAPARLLSIYSPQAWFGGGQFFAPNPDFGATIDYYLRASSGGDVEIAISDASDRIVRRLQVPARRGLNRVAWDLRMEPPIVEGSREAPPSSGAGAVPLGPTVLPGIYAVTLKAPGSTLPLKAPLRVGEDPRVTFSESDRRARQTLLIDLHELQKTLGGARGAARAATTRLDAMRKDGKTPSSDAGPRLAQLQSDIASELNTAGALSRALEGYSGPPTQDQRRQIDWVFDDVAKTVEDLNRVLRSDGFTSTVQLSLPPRR
jgi:hypothetical protein